MASVRSIMASVGVQLTLAPIDMFAELIVVGWTIREIREYLKLTEDQTQTFLKNIRDRGQ